MIPGERELYQRFAAYDDEELLRILTDERANYRSEALAAAEMVLTQRGVAPPTFFATPGPLAAAGSPATQGRAARPKPPYQLIHFAFDVVLLWLVCWALAKLWSWTMSSPEWLWNQLAFYVLASQLVGSAAALRRRWRTKEWRDSPP